MKSVDTFFSMRDFFIANMPRNLNKSDYIHAFFSQHGLPKDVAISLLDLISPDFELQDGVLLLGEFYAKDQYEQHVQNESDKKMIQFWSNILDLTSMFECDEYLVIKDFADGLTFIWNKKIEALGYQDIAVAKAFLDEDDNSVYITISSP